LEKAALTLGSRPAMNTLALSPAVLDRAPILYAPPDPAAHPVPIEGLYQIQQFLLTDPYARHALYAVPSAPSLGQVQLLFALWWKLGHSLPVAPVLWPEVVTFQPGAAVDFSRWPGRNVIALAPLDQWPVFLPKGTTPALRLTSPDTLTVLMQGRKQTRAELDPDLAFAQLMVSPRSITNTMILVGGWRDYAVPAVKRPWIPWAGSLLTTSVTSGANRSLNGCAGGSHPVLGWKKRGDCSPNRMQRSIGRYGGTRGSPSSPARVASSSLPCG
jgi:hypothetical protein